MTKYFIADPLHINQKNFSSLYAYLGKTKADVRLHQERQDWMTLCSDYRSKWSELQKEYEWLSRLQDDDLFAAQSKCINLFQVARAEILLGSMAGEHWSGKPLVTDLRSVFDHLAREERELLLWNMAAAKNWIEYWLILLARQPTPDYVLVFSGSLIYARALLEVMKSKPPRVFVGESFFTGNEYYLEEKYEPIANNSDLRHLAYCASLSLPTDPSDMDRERTKAINKVLGMKNKNVVQPKPSSVNFFGNDRPSILILGQVLNDFSLIEYRGIGFNSLNFYRRLIQELLDRTEFNVVFKSHPWELQKVGLRAPITKSRLERDFNSYLVTPDSNQGRLKIVEDHNLKSLFEVAHSVVGLSSQGMLEAAFSGIRPTQFGDAFFGRKGFTNDYALDAVATFVSDLLTNKIENRLGLAEYQSFEIFLTKALQGGLVSASPSGQLRLKELFGRKAPIKLTQNVQVEQVPRVAMTNAPIPVSPAPAPANQLIVRAPAGSIHRKLRKLRRSPGRFFTDAKLPIVRAMGVFFRHPH